MTDVKSNKTKTTIIRVKRKRFEDPVDTLLVAQETVDKKLKSIHEAKVFKFVESIETQGLQQPHLQNTLTKARESIKQPISMEKRKEILSAKRLKQAQEARFKIIETNRNFDNVHLIDVTRDEDYGLDEVTLNLMPMVREHLAITEPEKHNDFVYDLYYHDVSAPVADALETNVGTLGMNEDGEIFLDDAPDSEYDSEDSNAEDYYKNDYPDEDSEDEFQYQQESDVLSSEDDYEHY
ncbi:hypothetical protein HDV04_002093 [Boothiomyces sp. JEL0838]|nr:hypothetical protein HDV04_002093 [Boothiomyces sp. JEL0838]